MITRPTGEFANKTVLLTLQTSAVSRNKPYCAASGAKWYLADFAQQNRALKQTLAISQNKSPSRPAKPHLASGLCVSTAAPLTKPWRPARMNPPRLSSVHGFLHQPVRISASSPFQEDVPCLRP